MKPKIPLLKSPGKFMTFLGSEKYHSQREEHKWLDGKTAYRFLLPPGGEALLLRRLVLKLRKELDSGRLSAATLQIVDDFHRVLETSSISGGPERYPSMHTYESYYWAAANGLELFDPEQAPGRDRGPFETTHVLDGGRRVTLSAKYERNGKNRKAAIAIHGIVCQVCGFDFSQRYPGLGDGYIEVHHLVPLHESGSVAVNPKTDLACVCSNCHSMFHRERSRILTIEDLRSIMKP